ncbi:MAG: hypothetical protein C0171_06200, partial [Caldisphaera sp.]
ALGLKESNGDIITLLEDDDKYRYDRLEKIYIAFSIIPNLIYFHNEQMIIKKNGRVILLKSLSPNLKIQRELNVRSSLLSKTENNTGICYYQILLKLIQFSLEPDFNNSSIAMSRWLIDIDLLKPMEAGIDLMLFVLALKSVYDKSLLHFTTEPLIYYRIHKNSISDLAYGIAYSGGYLEDADAIKKLIMLSKIIKWHSYVAKNLQAQCKCNDYNISVTLSRLKSIYTPSAFTTFIKISNAVASGITQITWVQVNQLRTLIG